jgi:hypothetical protein
MIDLAAIAATIENVCGGCGEAEVDTPIQTHFKIIEGSWDGCDLFRDPRYFPRVIFCTARIAELAKQHGFTNCCLDEMK